MFHYNAVGLVARRPGSYLLTFVTTTDIIRQYTRENNELS